MYSKPIRLAIGGDGGFFFLFAEIFKKILKQILPSKESLLVSEYLSRSKSNKKFLNKKQKKLKQKKPVRMSSSSFYGLVAVTHTIFYFFFCF